MCEVIWVKSVRKREGHCVDRRYLEQATMSMSMDRGEDKKDDCPCQQPTKDGPSQTM